MGPEQIFFLVGRLRDGIQRHLGAEMNRPGLAELAPTHGDILFVLAKQGRASMQELARAIDRDKSTVTALVDKLVALGFVEKVPDPVDGRGTIVVPTKRARQAIRPMFAISRKLLRRAYRGIAPEERKQLIALLGQVYKNLA